MRKFVSYAFKFNESSFLSIEEIDGSFLLTAFLIHRKRMRVALIHWSPLLVWARNQNSVLRRDGTMESKAKNIKVSSVDSKIRNIYCRADLSCDWLKSV